MRDTGLAVYLQTEFLFDRLTPWRRIFLQLLVLNSIESAELHAETRSITIVQLRSTSLYATSMSFTSP
jgi:hypothetical protein